MRITLRQRRNDTRRRQPRLSNIKRARRPLRRRLVLRDLRRRLRLHRRVPGQARLQRVRDGVCARGAGDGSSALALLVRGDVVLRGGTCGA